MPKLQCPTCANWVRVTGVAAICPHCGGVVGTSEAPKTDIKLAPVKTDPDPKAGKPGMQPMRLPQGAALVGIGAGAMLVLFLLVYVILRLLTAPPAPPPAPPVRPVVTLPPATAPVAEAPAPAIPATQPTTDAIRVAVPATTRPHSHLALLKPEPMKGARTDIVTDEAIETAIRNGVAYILSKFDDKGVYVDGNVTDVELEAGIHAMAVYTLLHAGQAINDPRLRITDERMKLMIERLKEYPMRKEKAVYQRSLRISALTVYNRAQDRAQVQADLDYLLRASMDGAYDYQAPEEAGKTRANARWDNSNTQYGQLGVWAAADAGYTIPPTYWKSVENHWIATQGANGYWSYDTIGGDPSLAFTSGAITMLFVARQFQAMDAGWNAQAPETRALTRGLEWMETGENSVRLPMQHRAYVLYSMERAGLASGYKFFGKHDWFLTLAARTILDQNVDGSWINNYPGSWPASTGPIVETSFSVLFLARGRHPISMMKLRFDGNWTNKPRDVANLTLFTSRQLERELNYQVVGLDRDWREWSDSPLLFISSDRAPNFSDEDIAKLRNFVYAGGMIFTHADRGAPAFNEWVSGLLAPKLISTASLQKVSENHPLYSVLFPIGQKPELSMISNGNRVVLVHSPTDLSRLWIRRPTAAARPAMEMATNVIVYAAGKRDFRNRVMPLLPSAPPDNVIGEIPVARVRHPANWDPEPGAWQRFSSIFQWDTSIRLRIVDVNIDQLNFDISPIAILTGTDALAISDEELDSLRRFVADGGSLLIDAAGGAQEFARSIRERVLHRIGPVGAVRTLQAEHPLMRATRDGMKELPAPTYRLFATESREGAMPQMQIVEFGRGMVVFSELDLTCGILGANTWGLVGYTPLWSQDFVRNFILWGILR